MLDTFDEGIKGKGQYKRDKKFKSGCAGNKQNEPGRKTEKPRT